MKKDDDPEFQVINDYVWRIKRFLRRLKIRLIEEIRDDIAEFGFFVLAFVIFLIAAYYLM